ncbi:unnamed protein product [Psylliodes chrysocephalus]|uniref:Uncharacterized protein n=1 Tax=Psylliodes chrysocephalus TaxID=3402493 RepID=A0A9P0G6Q8_9CUCU|nr:unnamed protein product [Psylliodes chrysocephala]
MIDNLHQHQNKSCKLISNRTGESSRGTKRSAASSPDLPVKKAHNGRYDSCDLGIPTNQMSSHMRSLGHKEKACTIQVYGIHLIQSAFKCRIVVYRVKSGEKHIDYITFFDEIKFRVFSKVVLSAN